MGPVVMSTFLTLSALAFTAWILWDNCELCQRSHLVGFEALEQAASDEPRRRSKMRHSFREFRADLNGPDEHLTGWHLEPNSASPNLASLPSSGSAGRPSSEALQRREAGQGRRSGAGMSVAGANF